MPIKTILEEKRSNVPEDGPELSTETRLHEHVEILPIFEGLEELDDKLTVGLLHDLLLRHDVLLLSRLNDLKTKFAFFKDCLIRTESHLGGHSR